MPAIFAIDVATGYRFGLSDLYCIVALMTLRLAGPRPARAVVSAGFLLILASVVDSHHPSALVHAAISIALLGTVSLFILRGARADLWRHRADVASKSAVAGVPRPLLDELRQPLSVLLSDGRASLRWLKREQPDLPEALLCAQRIVTNAARAGEMIAAIGRGAMSDAR
ncbi:hypothetical protein [Bradyrhizobium sp. STM 3557]|uniref:hypothetical protein n=1 Tax=Bradyrhizobium sp. STM 3557 TaxID=578920 RepID=UPI00388F4440